LCRSGATLRLSFEEGGGEDACRRAMRRMLGNVEGEVRLLGVVPAAGRRPAIEVWLVRRLRRDLTAVPPAGLPWFAPQDLNARVLALAEDERTPLAARLRFLAIVSTNLDQFFMVQVGALKHQVASGGGADTERSPDGLTPAEQLDAIAIRVHPLVARHDRSFQAVAPAAATAGLPIRTWSDLAAGEREALDRLFKNEVAPLLTPKALTRAPGHPFPHLADRRLSL